MHSRIFIGRRRNYTRNEKPKSKIIKLVYKLYINSYLNVSFDQEKVKLLLDYIIKFPKEDDYKIGYKFPFIASEILNCDIDKILNYFFTYEDKNNKPTKNSEEKKECNEDDEFVEVKEEGKKEIYEDINKIDTEFNENEGKDNKEDKDEVKEGKENKENNEEKEERPIIRRIDSKEVTRGLGVSKDLANDLIKDLIKEVDENQTNQTNNKNTDGKAADVNAEKAISNTNNTNSSKDIEKEDVKTEELTAQIELVKEVKELSSALVLDKEVKEGNTKTCDFETFKDKLLRRPDKYQSEISLIDDIPKVI